MLAKFSGLKMKKDSFFSCLQETVCLWAHAFHKDHDCIPHSVGLEESRSPFQIFFSMLVNIRLSVKDYLVYISC